MKSGSKKNNMKVKRNVSVATKRVTRRRETSARQSKALKTIRQRRKTALKRRDCSQKIQWKSRKI